MTETLIQTEERAERLEESLDADAPCTAELAECTCPDFCERDHDNE
jgi:hypothetical protein